MSLVQRCPYFRVSFKRGSTVQRGGGEGGGHSHRLYSHSCDHSWSMVNGQSGSKGCGQRSKTFLLSYMCMYMYPCVALVPSRPSFFSLAGTAGFEATLVNAQEMQTAEKYA